MIKKIKKGFNIRFYLPLFNKVRDVFTEESGELKSMIWLIGTAVVCVLIIVVFMTLAPQTTQTIWNQFTQYMHTSFGF